LIIFKSKQSDQNSKKESLQQQLKNTTSFVAKGGDFWCRR